MPFPELYLERLVGLKATRPRKQSSIWEQCCNSTFASDFTFEEIIVHGVTVIVAELIVKDKIIVTKLTAKYNEMKSYFDFPILLLLPSVDSMVRRNLLNKKINFVVPGQQIYFPELYISLKESDSIKRIKPKQLSLPAQVLLLYHLQKRSLTDSPLSEIAKLIGYSNKTISLVVQELQNLGIAKLIPRTNRTKTLSFYRSGADLWNQIEKYLQNPIAQHGYTDRDLTPLKPILCGIAVEYRNIPGYSYIEFGITLKEARVAKLKVYATRKEHSLHLWRYDPRILADSGYADILSTILAYDRFHRSSITARLLPHVKWADI